MTAHSTSPESLHPVADFVRQAVAGEPELVWPGEIDGIIDDAERFEAALQASPAPLDADRLARALVVVGWHPVVAGNVARLVAPEYARLQSTEAADLDVPVEALTLTPPLLAAYRKRHVIAPMPSPSGGGWIDRNCGVRVVERDSGSRPLLWRHDPGEIGRLAAAERGEEPWASTYRG